MNDSALASHWLLLRLEGTKSNRDGIGAKVRIDVGRVSQYNHVTTSVGFASASDRRVHFGLGRSRVVDALEVVWPSGTHQVLHNLKADQILDLKEP